MLLHIDTYRYNQCVVNYRDIGVIDEEGFYTICGRIKDIIIRGGENINPLNLENKNFHECFGY